MSIGSATDTDFEDAIEVPLGCDCVYQYSVSPFDGTGLTGLMTTDFGTFAVTLTVTYQGDVPVTTFYVTIPNASLPAAGVYSWKIQLTWPTSPSYKLQYGHGSFYVKGS